MTFRTGSTRRWRLWLRPPVAGIMTALALWLAGLVWFANGIPDRVEHPDTPTDAIVVLTGGSERLVTGLDLLAAKKAHKLFVSGVYHGVEVVELLRLSRQAPDDLQCCIALGYAASDTVGNARETAEWMAQEGYDSLRLVTASYHMRRSLLEFRRAMPGVAILAHPVFPPRFKQQLWWRWPGTAWLTIREYNKYLFALARAAVGDLASRR